MRQATSPMTTAWELDGLKFYVILHELPETFLHKAAFYSKYTVVKIAAKRPKRGSEKNSNHKCAPKLPKHDWPKIGVEVAQRRLCWWKTLRVIRSIPNGKSRKLIYIGLRTWIIHHTTATRYTLFLAAPPMQLSLLTLSLSFSISGKKK